jgi:hypothetical protein
MSKFYLSLLGLLALSATTANAQTWTFSYDDTNKTATITSVTDAKGDITLPETTEKDGTPYKVTAIQGGDGTSPFYNNTDITSVDLGSTLTAINDHAFKGCSNLESVTGGSSVNWIGPWAFESSGLKYFTWPEKMSYIEDGVFFNCPNLITVALPKQGLTGINQYAFQFCKSLQYLTIPASVTNFGYRWLSDTPSMKEVIYLGTTTPVNEGYASWDNCTFYITAANTKEGWTDPNVRYDYPITLSANDGTYAFDHFGRDFAVDFSGADGLSAYVAYNLADGHLLMKKVSQLPAGAGAWLIGEQGKTYTVKILASVDNPAYDILTANLDRTVSGDESRSDIVWNAPVVTPDEHKYSTLVSPYPLDFTNSGLKAYLAKYANDVVTYTDVSKVPANTPVLVCGETAGQEYSIDFLKQEDNNNTDDVTANGLQGSATETTTCDGTQYGLGVVDNKLGWYKMTEGTLAAGKAYLSISSSSAKSFYEIPATIVTGISTVNADKKADDVYYDLMGRRVYAPQHGVYIHNGKKVVVK